MKHCLAPRLQHGDDQHLMRAAQEAGQKLAWKVISSRLHFPSLYWRGRCGFGRLRIPRNSQPSRVGQLAMRRTQR
jgi:hypothetical protein